MKVLLQVWPPDPEPRFNWTYEGCGCVPVPSVGEQIMPYRLGGLPLVVRHRLYHYMPESITVRLVCTYPEAGDFERKSVPEQGDI